MSCFDWKKRHTATDDDIEEVAKWYAINCYWEELSEEERKEAEHRYDTESFMRHTYQDPRELAYNQFYYAHPVKSE